MVKLVASEGIEFASVSVDEGTALYVDGSAAEVPFFWVMGPKFGFRVQSEGTCPNCGFPLWTATFTARSFNGAGSEHVTVDTSTQEIAEGATAPMVAAAFALQWLDVMEGGLLAVAEVLGFDLSTLPGADMVTWVDELRPDLVEYASGDMLVYEARQEAARFDSIRLDEIV